jgi:REP element-mobilizing transposase RayT
MPRIARLDALGCVQHVTARGIERRAIFRDDRDRLRFLDLLEGVLRESAAVALAWALMPNHFHMIVRTHGDPLSRLMARLNTAYAVGFNLRHDRAGHLFQNRYHSKPIEDDDYLRTAICYVHRNPIRAGLVPDLASLESHRWTGYGELVGRVPRRFLDIEAVLLAFADDPSEARSRLAVWMAASEPASSRPTLRNRIALTCRRFGVSEADLLGASRDRRVCDVRSMIAHQACDVDGYRQAEVARALGVGESSVHRARRRGSALMKSCRAEKQEKGTSPKAR